MVWRSTTAKLVAEFLGTFSLAGVVLATAGRTSFPYFSSTAAGLTLALMVLVIGSISGAHINPAVTIGLWTVKKISAAMAALYVIAQLLAGLASWSFNEYLLGKPLTKITGTGFNWRVLIAEVVGTLIFTLGISSAIYQDYKGLRKAVTIGGSLTIGVLLATFASNGVLNPAVAIGVRSWSLSYVAGPIIGAVIGINLYAYLFAPVLNAPKAVAQTATKRPTVAKKKTTKKR